MARAGKGMGHDQGSGHNVGTTDPNIPDESDLAQDIRGTNRLQGNDQSRIRNQRTTMPDETKETEGVIESFEKMDPKKRV